MKNRIATILILGLLMLGQCFAADIPRVLNYQGRVASGGVVFQGTGQFKFALVNGDGTVFYWRNDGATGIGEPATTVALNVTKGLFSVRLGDTAFPNMAAIPDAVFQNTDLRLRVWFNDGVKGFQQFQSDSALAGSTYAYLAATTLPQDLVYFIPKMPLTAANQTNYSISKAETIPPLVTRISGISFNYSLNHVNLGNGNTNASTRVGVSIIAINGETQQETVLYTFTDELVGFPEQLKTNTITANPDLALDHSNYSYEVRMEAICGNLQQTPAPRFAQIKWVKVSGKK